jgi:hypothetical protein
LIILMRTLLFEVCRALAIPILGAGQLSWRSLCRLLEMRSLVKRWMFALNWPGPSKQLEPVLAPHVEIEPRNLFRMSSLLSSPNEEIAFQGGVRNAASRMECGC